MGQRIVMAADLFCGGGGTSSGLWLACQQLKAKLQLLAVNHWNIAISTHQANHSYATHLCESIDNVDPRKAVPGGKLNLLVASPECTHHSNARGGKPMSDQSRASAWHILRWAEALYIDSIIIENVREFKTWGPIGQNGRPMKSKRGETYLAFLNSLRSLGYTVEDRVLNSADFGDPTTRERLFIMARRGGRKITWPEPTHASDPTETLFGKLEPWRPARDIIDWSIQGGSIFNRKRPLAPATLSRIEAGLRKFGGLSADPFLVILRRHADARSLNEPLPTLTAGGQHLALCEPFVLQQQSGGVARSVDQPLPTVATKGAISLVQPFIMPVNHGAEDRRSYSLERPMPTVTTVDAWGFVEPFLVKYYGTAKARPLSEPLDAVTTKDRFALIETENGPAHLDIRFRMLRPHELAQAMSFGRDYKFSGNREQQVKQIGNAVPVRLAQSLCHAVLS
jgi:DNA (cytosine-5)-methyltransferase 1